MCISLATNIDGGRHDGVPHVGVDSPVGLNTDSDCVAVNDSPVVEPPDVILDPSDVLGIATSHRDDFRGYLEELPSP